MESSCMHLVASFHRSDSGLRWPPLATHAPRQATMPPRPTNTSVTPRLKVDSDFGSLETAQRMIPAPARVTISGTVNAIAHHTARGVSGRSRVKVGGVFESALSGRQCTGHFGHMLIAFPPPEADLPRRLEIRHRAHGPATTAALGQLRGARTGDYSPFLGLATTETGGRGIRR